MAALQPFDSAGAGLFLRSCVEQANSGFGGRFCYRASDYSCSIQWAYIMRIFQTGVRFFLLIATACSEQVIHETDGGMGDNGLNCWDVDGNERTHGRHQRDGVVDVDCQPGVDGLGSDGQHCWDTNGNGQMDPEEDERRWNRRRLGLLGPGGEHTGGGGQPTVNPISAAYTSIQTRPRQRFASAIRWSMAACSDHR